MAKRSTSGIEAHVIKVSALITKTSTTEAIDSNAAKTAGNWITPPVDMRGLKHLVKHSSILPQCIRAYKNNIAGFGIGIRYKENVEETPDMAAEFTKAEEILNFLNMDQDTKEVLEDVIEAREIYGIAYLEVIRNVAGEVIGIDLIRDTPSIQKSISLAPFIDVEYHVKDRTEKRPKKFCQYRQQIGGQTVYFKEIGDPRPMDMRTGVYADAIALEYQANEILEFAIGTAPYGEVRWIGQILGIDGSRKAEGLNNRYFEEGRHTPLMIMIKGGTLTDDSFTKLQQYVEGIKGESGQHAFIVLEAANTDARTDMEADPKPEIEIVKLADILQKDELFQDYLDNNRRKVQSAFQLPDLYVGYTTDFNRATSQTAQEVTEEQVFQPERQSFAWAINNKLLAGYGFRYVEAYFKDPNISNPDDITKILNVAERAGGLTPNKAKDLVYSMFGETAEPYEGGWGEIPLAYARQQEVAGGGLVDIQLAKQIRKAEHDGANGEIVAVLKEVRKLLAEKEARDGL